MLHDSIKLCYGKPLSLIPLPVVFAFEENDMNFGKYVPSPKTGGLINTKHIKRTKR